MRKSELAKKIEAETKANVAEAYQRMNSLYYDFLNQGGLNPEQAKAVMTKAFATLSREMGE